MQDPAAPGRSIRFGPFDLNVRSSELHKGPTRLKVPDQSIEILKALLEQPGELVTRERLRERLWPSDTFVERADGTNPIAPATGLACGVRTALVTINKIDEMPICKRTNPPGAAARVPPGDQEESHVATYSEPREGGEAAF
jgi:hypothetical protein